MVRFSQKVLEHPWIEEIGLNPMLASSKVLLAPDARVLLHALSLHPDQPQAGLGKRRWQVADGAVCQQHRRPAVLHDRL